MSSVVTSPFSLQQKVFTLSWLSNRAVGKVGLVAPLETETATLIDAGLTDPLVTRYIGEWQIIWGPVIFESREPAGGPSSNVADNTMVVFKGTDGGNPVVVVAIAGTNYLSLYGMGAEDLVGPTPVQFSGDAWIATGTHRGVQILENMQDPGGRGTIQAFLQPQASTGTTLIFTGHSLGGALSPSLALDLAVNKQFDLTRWAKVYVFPSAGPTPGNQAFSDLFARTFPQVPPTDPAVPFNAWNMDISNSLDIVPRAWAALSTLPDLYSQPDQIGVVSEVQTIVDNLTTEEKLATNRYATLPTSPITGIFQPFPNHNKFSYYLREAMHQHIFFYAYMIIGDIQAALDADAKAAKQ
jgi:hypothetical protein